MDKISAHISYDEATKSPTAIRLGIDNTPSAEQLENMKLLAEKVVEPMREYISRKRGKDTPIQITSFFRCDKLNEAIGGASHNGVQTSQHCKGEAVDLETNYSDFTNKDLFLVLKERATFDQLIFEFSDSKNPDIPAWVHVSYSKTNNRKQVLRAVKVNGVSKYIPFE